MSAESSPACGRAAGRFSTLTASAGRSGTLPPGAASPVSGHIGGSLWTTLSMTFRMTAGAFPVAYRNAVVPPSTTTTVDASATHLVRRLIAKERNLRDRGRSGYAGASRALERPVARSERTSAHGRGVMLPPGGGCLNH